MLHLTNKQKHWDHLRRALAEKRFASVYLATDTHRVEAVRKEIADTLSVPLAVRSG